MKKSTLILGLLALSLAGKAQIITTVAGNGTAGYGGDGESATASQINNPEGICIDAWGNIIIADRINHRIRKVNTAGVITTIAGTGTAGFSGDGGAATAANLSAPISVATDMSGRIIIADFGNQRVRAIDTNGIIETIAGTGSAGYSGDSASATAAQLSAPTGLATDVTGNIYISDNGNNRIRKVLTTGMIITIAGNGTYGAAGDGGAATSANLARPRGIDVDQFGNIFIADYENHRIRRVNTSGVITTVAGNGTAGFSGDGSAATAAKLNYPIGVCRDDSGYIYIADRGNYRVRKINLSGNIFTITGNGSSGYSGDGSVATSGRVSYLTGIANSADGKLYLSDRDNNRVRKIAPAPFVNNIPIFTTGSNFTTSVCAGRTVALNSKLVVRDLDNGQPLNWRILRTPIYGTATVTYTATSNRSTVTPVGLQYTADSVGSLVDTFSVVVADSNNSDTIIARVVINPLPNAGVISGPDTTDAGGASIALVSTRSGGIWKITDLARARIDSAFGVFWGLKEGVVNVEYKFTNSCGSASTRYGVFVKTPPAVITTYAGNGINQTSSDGILRTAAKLSTIYGIAKDKNGNLYFGEGNKIRKISPAGVITTIAGSTNGFSGDNGPAVSARISYASHIAVDTNLNIYFCDRDNKRVRKISNTGTITTIAGNGSLTFVRTATIATATGMDPCGVAVDRNGHVYIVDKYNHRVRKVVGSTISNIAGNGFSNNGVGGFSGDNEVATAARLNQPEGIAVDISGNVYIGDDGNRRIRKVATNGRISTIAGCESCGSVEGEPAVNYGLIRASNVAVDNSGNIYFVNESKVMRIASNGTISTYAGQNTFGYTGDTRLATNAQLSYVPRGLCTDILGNVFVSDNSNSYYNDRDNNVIRKIGSPYTDTSISISSSRGRRICRATGVTFQAKTLGISAPHFQWKVNGMNVGSDSSSFTTSTLLNNDTVTCYLLSTASGPVLVHSNALLMTVDSTPVASSITGRDTFCTGIYTNLSANITGSESYSFTSSNTSVATVTYYGSVYPVSSGTATITFSYVNACGTSNSTRSITVNTSPAVGTISGAGDSILCTGEIKTLTETVSGGTWSSSNPSVVSISSSGLSSSIGAVTDGSSTISYTMVSGVCTKAATLNVFVNPTPFAGDINGDDYVCANYPFGEPFTVYAPDTVGFWGVVDTNIASIDSSGYILGKFIDSTNLQQTFVTYNVTNRCGITGSSFAYIAFKPIPVRPTVTGPSALCQGSSAYFGGSPSGGIFYRTGSHTTCSASGYVTGVSVGTSIITYASALNSYGCRNRDYFDLSIEKRVANNSISGTSVLCAGTATTLSNPTPGGSWSHTNFSVATLSGPTLTSIAAGIDTVYYTVSNSCGITSAKRSIIVQSFPNAGTLSGVTTVNVGRSTVITNPGITGGFWSMSDTSLAVVNSSGRVTGRLAGVDTIKYTLTNVCGTAVATKNITIVASGGKQENGNVVSESNLGLSLMAYPNPTTGSVTLEVTGYSGGVSVSVVDLNGRIILEDKSAINKLTFDMSKFAAGAYWLTVNAGNQMLTEKVIIQ